MLLAPKYKFGLVKKFTIKNSIEIQGYHGPATHNHNIWDFYYIHNILTNFIYIYVCKI